LRSQAQNLRRAKLRGKSDVSARRWSIIATVVRLRSDRKRTKKISCLSRKLSGMKQAQWHCAMLWYAIWLTVTAAIWRYSPRPFSERQITENKN
jgi:hypothetical protein